MDPANQAPVPQSNEQPLSAPPPDPVPAPPEAPSAQPVLFAPDTPQSVSFNSQTKSKKPLKIAIGGALLFALLAGGAVFGYILPNRPETVWNTGLNRSGKALDKLVGNATEKTTLEKFTKSDVTGTMTAKMGEQTFSGTLATKYDATGANGSLVVKSKDKAGKETTYGIDVIGELLKDHAYPTAHLRFNGLKELGLDDYLNGLAGFDNKWITIDENFLTAMGAKTSTDKTETITASDIAEISNAVMSVTTERVFTSDPKLAVFERKSIVGKETVDGISAFHYTVGFNMNNSIAFCNALVDKVTATAAYKKLPTYNAANFEDDKKSAHKDCDNIKDSKNFKDQTFDMWIDAKYKLVYKIRILDENNKEAYTDIGQSYKGGDDINLFVKYHDSKAKVDGAFNMKTNIKTSQTSADIAVKGGSADSPFELTFTMSAKPYTGTIDTKAPAGAIKVEDMMKQLGLDPSMFFGGGSTPASTYEDDFSYSSPSTTSVPDATRKADINALFAKLEEYFNENSDYPTLANLSSKAWRTTNLKGLRLTDDAVVISGKTGADVISYIATGCDAKGCQKFTLATTVSTGVYTKYSLN